MEIKFIDNQDTKLSAVLVSELKGSLDTRLAVAFVSSSGLTLLEQSILEALSNGGQIEMLVGLDFTTTEARALWKLNTWGKEQTSKTIKSFILCATKGLQYASKANANSQGFSWLVETCL